MTTELKAVTPKSQAALETGLDESQIRNVVFEMNYLKRHGLLVDIRISGSGMFTRLAQLGEFGIAWSDEKAKRYTAGSKFLIPKKRVDKLRSVEVRMRQAFLKYAIDVAGFRPYRWLPYTGYQNFKARWNELKAEFETEKAIILENLDYYRDQVAGEFAAGARKTWAAIEGQGYSAMIIGGQAYLDRDSFVDAVVSLALAQFPTEEKVAEQLQADYAVGVIFTDVDSYQEEELAAQAVKKAEHDAQAAYLQASLLQEQYSAERRMNQLALQEKELQIEAMMAAEMAHAKEQLENIRHPFEEVFISLRQQIAQACDEMKASIQKNGFVRGKIAERGRGLLDFYDLMAAHNDKELRAKLVELREAIGPIGDERTSNDASRDTESVAKTLAELAEMAEVEAKDLANLSRAAFLEI